MAANQSWILKARPKAGVSPGTLDLIEAPISCLADGDVLVRTIYLSIDPTNRIWMSERDQYLAPVEVGTAMRGGTIGIVEESRSPKYAIGDLVQPHMGSWSLYEVHRAEGLMQVRPAAGIPLSAYMSVMGATGITAYFGVEDICAPVLGETFVVTGAGGAVGSIAGQIAALKGAHVVGIAGGREKCAWLRQSMGFHDVVDYKNEDIASALDRACPNGIDMSFENVGGTIMEAVYDRMNVHGRMALCGLISSYNDEGPMPGPADFGRLLMKRLAIRGFLLLDYLPRAREALQALSGWIASGQLRWRDDIVAGLESAPAALDRLFAGGNMGKMIVQVSPEPDVADGLASAAPGVAA